MKLDNCSSILKIYRKIFLPCSFTKIFAIEVSAFFFESLDYKRNFRLWRHLNLYILDYISNP